jgi:hypothetical protein
MLNAFVPVLFFESFTCTVNEELPGDVGFPEIVPDAASVKPAGSAPAVMLHEYGVVPPLAASVVEYALLTVPSGSEAVVTEGGCAAAPVIVILNACMSVCCVGEVESVTVAVKLNCPGVVGVPEMTPFACPSESPFGSEPEEIDQL